MEDYQEAVRLTESGEASFPLSDVDAARRRIDELDG